MHDIEPYYHWRDDYNAAEDHRSPLFGRTYDAFYFTQKVYNYLIHPQWDSFGSQTLYLKILYADYDHQFVIIEMIGEWNDCLHNDIMYLKREIIDPLFREGIIHFIMICENVLNFHGSDDCYYEEWQEEIAEEGGWICLVNTLQHVEEEMKDTKLQYFMNFGMDYNSINWRPQKPKLFFRALDALVHGQIKRIR